MPQGSAALGVPQEPARTRPQYPSYWLTQLLVQAIRLISRHLTEKIPANDRRCTTQILVCPAAGILFARAGSWEEAFWILAQLNKIKCRFVELKSGRAAESQQGRGQKSAPLLCFVPLPSSPPVAGAGDVKRPHAPAPPPPDGGGREGKVKKAPALHLGLAGNRKETGCRWRAGRPCSIIVAQAF